MNTNAAWVSRDLARVWHPCTQMKDHEWLPPIPIRRAEGVWLEDFEGNRYLDAISSWWVNLFGHRNPRIIAALKDQLDTLEHVLLAGFTHSPAIELAEQLCAVAPAGLARCFYADNGSSAIEIALKMSFHAWLNQGQHQKKKFVTLSNSYHGETLGALAVGDVGFYRDTYAPLMMERLVVPSPDCYHRAPDVDWETHTRHMFAHMREILEQRHHEIAAVIIEPLVQCAGGMRMYHPVYLRLLRETCDQLDIHLIADEIAVGFGRTGTLFACEQAHITPDFLCLSKGLTGGYLPLAAVLTTSNIYQAFYDDYPTHKAFLHSHSYTGNPLGCRAALATLELFRSENTIATNQILAKQLSVASAKLQEHPHIGEVRQTGMIVAVELVEDRATLRPYPPSERRGLRVYQHALKQGVLLRPLGNVIYFMPPYIITQSEIQKMMDVAYTSIHNATQ
jgi:adenosylmethionine---8-amino-7-oxononanoate aminotransferase